MTTLWNATHVLRRKNMNDAYVQEYEGHGSAPMPAASPGCRWVRLKEDMRWMQVSGADLTPVAPMPAFPAEHALAPPAAAGDAHEFIPTHFFTGNHGGQFSVPLKEGVHLALLSTGTNVWQFEDCYGQAYMLYPTSVKPLKRAIPEQVHADLIQRCLRAALHGMPLTVEFRPNAETRWITLPTRADGMPKTQWIAQHEHREKPATITLNGVELPRPAAGGAHTIRLGAKFLAFSTLAEKDAFGEALFKLIDSLTA